MIVAAAHNDVIGVAGDLPWHLPEDLKRFKRLTIGHVVVAGRRTHDSIVERLGQALPGRVTVVVSREAKANVGRVLYQLDLAGALTVATEIEAFAGRDEVFVIGGAEVYAQALPHITRVYLTRLHRPVEGDTVMPDGWLEPFRLSAREAPDGDGFSWQTYERR